MRQGRARAQGILTAMDFPGEILTGVPVVELKGLNEAEILNHRGVIAYDASCIRIAASVGPVTLTGSDLRIQRMNRERIVIRGRIRRVDLGGETC